MLLSPLTLPESAARRRRVESGSRRRPSRAVALPHGEPASSTPALLKGWFALGVAVVLLVPAARGGELFGATLPFWLVAAPLLNLLWWHRRSYLRALRRPWTARRTRTAPSARRVSRAR